MLRFRFDCSRNPNGKLAISSHFGVANVARLGGFVGKLLNWLWRNFIPGGNADDLQGELRGIGGIVRIDLTENVINMTWFARSRHGSRLVGAEAETQATFVGMIDVAVVDEGFDAGKVEDALVGEGEGGGLQAFSLRGVKAVETLFGEDEPPGSIGE